uniref:Zinc finger protein 142 n=1 Tax=Mus musculus TaxID=10090 RepID=M0QWZ4_MOUSE
MTDPVLASQLANGTGEMDGLCSELLLIPPPLSNHGILGPVQNTCASGELAPLPADPGCLLVEATATEEGPGNMEIIVEAVTGTLSPGAPEETSAIAASWAPTSNYSGSISGAMEPVHGENFLLLFRAFHPRSYCQLPNCLRDTENLLRKQVHLCLGRSQLKRRMQRKRRASPKKTPRKSWIKAKGLSSWKGMWVQALSLSSRHTCAQNASAALRSGPIW